MIDSVDLTEALGFRVGQVVQTLVETSGDDHEDSFHIIPPGARCEIVAIERLAGQGIAFTIWISVTNDDFDDRQRGIVNVFDEEDGSITQFIKAEE